jgi:hypothetical protein
MMPLLFLIIGLALGAGMMRVWCERIAYLERLIERESRQVAARMVCLRHLSQKLQRSINGEDEEAK